jgi:hypothetical protein
MMHRLTIEHNGDGYYVVALPERVTLYATGSYEKAQSFIDGWNECVYRVVGIHVR